MRSSEQAYWKRQEQEELDLAPQLTWDAALALRADR